MGWTMPMRKVFAKIWIAAVVLSLMLMWLGPHQQAAPQRELLSGWMQVIWGDGAPGSDAPPKNELVLIDDHGGWTRLEIDPLVTEPFGGPLGLNRKRVAIAGWRTPGLPGALAQKQKFLVESIQTEDQNIESVAAGVRPTVAGPQRWVTILSRFADAANVSPRDVSYFNSLMGSQYPGMDHYWRELSFDTINLVGSTVVGWYNLPQPRSYYIYDMNGDGIVDVDFSRLVNDATGVADADVFFPSFVGINLAFNEDLDGYSYGGSWNLNRDGQTKTYGVTWLPTWGYGNQASMAHEMGHGFGFDHSSGPYGNTYDSRWEMMSNTFGNCPPYDTNFSCVGVHAISYHKDLVGWIPAARKYVPAQGSSQTITIERLEQPPLVTGDYLMAQIPIGGSSTQFYTVEARRFIGYDATLPGQAIIIHKVNTLLSDRQAQVVDPDGNGNPNDAGAMWIAGETFSDSGNGVVVAVNSAGASSYSVTIQLNAPNCTYSIAPTNAPYGASGGSGTVNVTSGAGCNWTATSNAGWINVTSGGSGSGIGTVNYSVGANAGAARSGTMTIAGRTFTVNQDAACSPTLAPPNQTFSAGGGADSVSVNIGAGCNWTATSNADWISITGGNNGTGSGTVNYSVTANADVARVGTISIGTQSFTIAQAGTGGTGGSCAATAAAQGMSDATDTLSLLYRFRDQVLARTARGQQYTRTFYQSSPEVVRIMLTNASLLSRTQGLLQNFKPAIAAIVNQGKALAHLSDLKQINDLIRSFTTVGSAGLQNAIEPLRRDLRDPKIHSEFGIKFATNRSMATSVVFKTGGDGSAHSSANATKDPGDRGLFVTDYRNNQVKVLISNGDGTFKPGQSVPVGEGPSAMAIGDFNHDGRMDLVTVNELSNDLSVLMGNGDGTFQRAQSIGVGTKPSAVLVDDFTGDGNADLAVADSGDNEIRILRGRGDGTFDRGQAVAVGNGPSAMAAADFNGDGLLDLVVSNFGSGDVWLLLGKGNGTFIRAGNFSAGEGPIGLTTGDFDGDGRPEVITVNFTSNDLTILKVNGSRGLAVLRRSAASEGPVALVSDELVAGRLSLAAANLMSGEISVWQVDEHGQLKSPQKYAVTASPSSITLGDFNGDGRLDLAVLDLDGVTLRVMLGNGDGTFKSAR